MSVRHNTQNRPRRIRRAPRQRRVVKPIEPPFQAGASLRDPRFAELDRLIAEEDKNWKFQDQERDLAVNLSEDKSPGASLPVVEEPEEPEPALKTMKAGA